MKTLDRDFCILNWLSLQCKRLVYHEVYEAISIPMLKNSTQAERLIRAFRPTYFTEKKIVSPFGINMMIFEIKRSRSKLFKTYDNPATIFVFISIAP